MTTLMNNEISKANSTIEASIGVAIPTYNRNNYLRKLLQTIPSSTDVFVSDNGGYVDESIKEQYPKAKVSIQTNILEMFDNWNAAANMVTSAWCLIPSDDDLYFNGAFDTLRKYIDKYPQADLFIFGHKIIDENDIAIDGWTPFLEKEYAAPQGFELFKYGVEARMPCVAFRTEFLKTLGFFDSRYKLTAADSELVQKALIKGRSVFVPEIIGAYRVWAGALTHKRMATKQWLEEVDYWQCKVEEMMSNSIYAQQAKHIRDEVYARNMIGGIYSLRKTGTLTDRLKFVLSNRLPWFASFKTKLRLIRAVI